jgi:hypothetical protein
LFSQLCNLALVFAFGVGDAFAGLQKRIREFLLTDHQILNDRGHLAVLSDQRCVQGHQSRLFVKKIENFIPLSSNVSLERLKFLLKVVDVVVSGFVLLSF